MAKYLILGLAALFFFACEESDESSEPASAQGSMPGALMVELETAMDSVSYSGQGAGLQSDWEGIHCKSSGSGVQDAYSEDETIKWGCKLAVPTDGPDTPRGAVARIKALSCSLDLAISAGTFVVDGSTYPVKVTMDDECWGESFAEMVKEQLPDLIDPNSGWVQVEINVTGYSSVPSSMNTSGEWEYAYIFNWGDVTGDDFKYHVLTRFDDQFIAASILEVSTDDDNPGVFSMAIEFDEDEADTAHFVYEGRFPWGTFGDGSYGSRHVRLKTSGAYAGSGGFSSISSGAGFEAETFGDNSGNLSGGRMSTFTANENGLYAVWWYVDTGGQPTGDPQTGWSGEDAAAKPTPFTYTGSTTELPSYLTNSISASYTSESAWHLANGPLSIETVTIGD